MLLIKIDSPNAYSLNLATEDPCEIETGNRKYSKSKKRTFNNAIVLNNPMPRSDKKRTLRPKSINKSNNDLNFDRGPDSNHILSLQNSPRAGSRIENLFIPDIQSTAQLIVEKTKNKRYKKQDIMNKCSRLKVRFDEGRNDVSPMRSLDRSRRFLSSSEIKESAENYLLESSISNQKCLEKLGKYTSPANKGQHPRFSPDLDLYKSMKPSVILKRNLYKLNKQLE